MPFNVIQHHHSTTDLDYQNKSAKADSDQVLKLQQRDVPDQEI